MKRRQDDDEELIATPEWLYHLSIALSVGLIAFGITKLLGLW